MRDGDAVGAASVAFPRALTPAVSAATADEVIARLRRWGTTRHDPSRVDRRGIDAGTLVALADMGLLGLYAPARLGGLGLRVRDIARVLEQLAAIDLTVGVFVLDALLTSHTLLHSAAPGLGEPLVTKVAAGHAIGAVAITEQGAGSNPRNLATTATPMGDGRWSLSGTKLWVGNASWANFVNVQAITDDGRAVGFCVPIDRPGLTVGPEVATMGVRGFPKHRVDLDGVEVRNEEMLGELGQGLAAAQQTMSIVRLCLAALGTGAMKRAVQLATRFATHRTVASGPLVDTPVTSRRLADATSAIRSLDGLVDVVAGALDAGRNVPGAVTIGVKVAASECMVEVIDDALQTLGARGYAENNPIARLARDARPFRIWEGPTEALESFLGSMVLADDADLREFLEEELGASDIARELSEAAREVADRALANTNDRLLGLDVARSQAGPLGVAALLRAGAGDDAAARQWADRTFAEVRDRATGEPPTTRANLLERIQAATASIGLVEPRAVPVEHELDEMLRVGKHDDSTAAVADAPSMSAEAVAELVRGFNDADLAPPDQTVPARILSQAMSTPDATAIVAVDGPSWTYGELVRDAGAAATQLAEAGVKPGDLVALAITRDPAFVVAALGTMLAGAGYVPLDPRDPVERRRSILDDARPRAVLVAAGATQDDLLTHLGDHTLVQLPDSVETSAEAVTSLASLDDVAYVIYTSGSSGIPKGVAVEHGCMAGFCTWSAKAYEITPNDRVLQFASLSFDAMVEEVFPALLAGASVVMRDDHMVASTRHFLDVCARERVTVLDLPTAWWRRLTAELAQNGSSIPSAVRLVIIGGERARRADVLRWQTVVGSHPLLVNTYGPTETTVVATWAPLQVVTLDSTRPVPIGRPVGHVRAYVVDDDGNLLPPGAIGELWLAGSAVARGYLGRDEMTAERFVEDPFANRLFGSAPAKWTARQRRCYRTGDRAAWTDDGQLLFHGRIDDQRKIRGHRVELGEIESVIAALPEVVDAAVTTQDAPDGEPRVVAHVVAEPGQRLEGPALLDRLRRRLPSYMVPSAVAMTESLPKTSSGKVDRRSLPMVDLATAPPGSVPPSDAPQGRTPTEALLLRLFAELLGGSPGPGDDFFALGGHSLMIADLNLRLREEAGVELRLDALFQHPTVAALAAHLDGHDPDAPDAELPPKSTVGHERVAQPLSSAQRALWMMAALHPEHPLFHEGCALDVGFDADADALRGALEAVVAAHDALRTRIAVVDGAPMQWVIDDPTVPFEVHDLRGTTTDPDERRRDVARALRSRPFDLDSEPPIRAAFVISGGRRELQIAFHHLVVDGTSFFSILLPQLQAAHDALRTGSAPDSVVQPSSFHETLTSAPTLDPAEHAELSERARVRLADLPVVHPPAAGPRTTNDRAGDQVVIDAPEGFAQRLQDVARAQRTTPFVFLVAALCGLMQRHGAGHDVPIGTVSSGRSPDQRATLGHFLDTMVLRVRSDPGQSGHELVQAAREAVAAALGDARLPFDEVVHAVRSDRGGGANLFDVALVVEPPIDEEGWAVDRWEVHNGTSQFDLLVEVETRGTTTRLRFEFAHDRYTRDVVDGLARQLLTLADAMLTDLHQPIDRLPLLDEAERARLEVLTSPPPRLGPAGAVHDLVASTVERLPDAVAVAHGDQACSYAQLWEASGKVAGALRTMAEPAQPVAVCLPRSIALPTSVLGVLRSGAAYVPIDPSYPEERRQHMLETADVGAIVTTAALSGDFASIDAPQLLVSADGRIEVGPASEDPPDVTVSAEDLAYVIFTSGSTGQPKGIAMPHRPLHHLVTWQQTTSQAREGWATTQFAPISFDVSFQEIFSTWATGGTLVLVDEETRRDPRRLLDLIDRHDVRRLYLPYVGLRTLADVAVAQGRSAPTLAEVITAGEQLKLTPNIRAFLRDSDAELHNHYGPSETHVVTWHRLTGDPENWADLPAIGRALPGTGVHVVDDHGSPVPVGVPGWLELSGEMLAHGYLGRADLTAERFRETSEGRRYVTGDTVRIDPDGALHYLGRADGQLKVRGFRVEPGEVEVAITRVAEVDDVKVVGRDGPTGIELVAYVIPAATAGNQNGDLAGVAADIRDRLAATVPEHLVPSHVVPLATFPTTPSGKVDVAGLPEPERTAGTPAHRAPSDADELQLCLMFAEAFASGDVVQADAVQPDDDFFRLGGHSLLAVRVITAVEQTFGVDLPITALFDHPTPARLLRRIRQSARESGPTGPTTIAMAPDPGGPTALLVPGSGGSVMYLRDLALALADHGLRPLGLPTDELSAADASSINNVADRIAVGAMHALAERPGVVIGHSVGACVAFELVRMLEDAGQPPTALVLVDIPAPDGQLEMHNDWDDAWWVAAVGEVMAAQAGLDIQLDEDRLRAAPPEERDHLLLAALVDVGLLAPETSPGRVRGVVDAMRAADEAYASHQPSRPLATPVVLARSTDGFAADRLGLFDGAEGSDDWGWGRWAPQLRIERLPGDHFSMLTGEGGRRLAELAAEHAGAPHVVDLTEPRAGIGAGKPGGRR